MKIVILLIIMSFSLSSFARNTFLDSLNKKTEVKKKTRWTLADWLDTKNKISLMDSWLAANSSANLFEFYVGASHYEFEDALVTPRVSDSTTIYTAAGFLTIFGLKYQQESLETLSRARGEVILRLMGKSEQSTRLNTFYGSEFIDDDTYTQQYDRRYYGGELRLYLLSFMAIEGRYQTYLESELPDSRMLKGDQIEYGILFDLGPFQLFGKIIKTTDEWSDNSRQEIEGARYGAHLYF